MRASGAGSRCTTAFRRRTTAHGSCSPLASSDARSWRRSRPPAGDRGGWTWTPPPGVNLTVSVGVDAHIPAADAWQLAAAAGLAVRDACLVIAALGLKWPNDIVSEDGHKVGGVLIETVLDGDAVAAAVIGIGLNVNWLGARCRPTCATMRRAWPSSPDAPSHARPSSATSSTRSIARSSPWRTGDRRSTAIGRHARPSVGDRGRHRCPARHRAGRRPRRGRGTRHRVRGQARARRERGDRPIAGGDGPHERFARDLPGSRTRSRPGHVRAAQADRAALPPCIDATSTPSTATASTSLAITDDAEDATERTFLAAMSASTVSGTSVRRSDPGCSGLRTTSWPMHCDHAGAIVRRRWTWCPSGWPPRIPRGWSARPRMPGACSGPSAGSAATVARSSCCASSRGSRTHEIADVLDRSEGAVRVLQHRALRDLAELLVEDAQRA